MKNKGSRREVFNSTARSTTGGLEKKDLLKNKYGRIVSRKKHISATKEKRLVKFGYGSKKGKFGFVKINSKKPKAKKSKAKQTRKR